MEIQKYAELTDRRTRVGAIKKGRCASTYSKSISINLYKIERMLSFCCESGGSADLKWRGGDGKHCNGARLLWIDVEIKRKCSYVGIWWARRGVGFEGVGI